MITLTDGTKSRAGDRYGKHEDMERCIQYFSGTVSKVLGCLDADWKVTLMWMIEKLPVQRLTSLTCNTFHDVMTLRGQMTNV